MVIIKVIEMVMGAVLILLSAVMFKWWLENDETAKIARQAHKEGLLVKGE